MSEPPDLRSASLPDDPVALYHAWRAAAVAADEPEPDAVALATVDPEGTPSVRFVLVRGVDALGVRIYTDRRSRKGAGLDTHATAALAIHWKTLERQVRIEGPVERLPDAESDAYWARRPRESQLSAWASAQGRELRDRAELETARAAIAVRFPDGEPVPRPDWWGGYLVRPSRWEFWQARPGRAHDRFVFARHGRSWTIARLAP